MLVLAGTGTGTSTTGTGTSFSVSTSASSRLCLETFTTRSSTHQSCGCNLQIYPDLTRSRCLLVRQTSARFD
jgi:hypothetical protein